RKTKDDIQDDCHARCHAPQCTSYSIRPLHPRDSGENDDFHVPLRMYTVPPCDYKRRRRASFKGDVAIIVKRSVPLSTRYWHSPQSTSPLAETWELPSLSCLACTPYYRHLRCKIIQCPRTPPCWTYSPAAGTRINSCVTVLPLASTSGTRKHATLLVGIRTAGSGHRQLARQVGARCVTFSLLFPFDFQGWRADPTHTPWASRIRSQRDT